MQPDKHITLTGTIPRAWQVMLDGYLDTARAREDSGEAWPLTVKAACGNLTEPYPYAEDPELIGFLVLAGLVCFYYSPEGTARSIWMTGLELVAGRTPDAGNNPPPQPVA